MDFHEILSDSCRKTADIAAKIIGENPDLFGKLVDFALEEKGVLAMRSARVVHLICLKDPVVIQPYINRIVSQMGHMSNPGQKRGFARIFAELPFTYDDRIVGRLVDVCFKWLAGPDEKVALKVYSMAILYKASGVFPVLRQELAATLENEIPRSSVAFNARARRMLQSLYREME